jgi:hypothetical protein
MSADDNDVLLDADQVIELYHRSVALGTDKHWPAIAIQWMQQASAELLRLTEEPNNGLHTGS